ncbi:NUDIX domain-containing protein [Limnohabitans sp.]|jgi:8-oxo-dGTP pyrophosphatase MutT (NUDIX family)|uniref:NUDIX hydrolase n=1 Tax=Limnohabitans sp. TaxID=1907725 RepID=UPI0037BF479B
MQHQPPEAAFWARLNPSQQDWLSQQLGHRQTPPSTGCFWTCDAVDVGWVPAERAQEMLAELPHCQLSQGRLHWRSAAHIQRQRSQTLQDFLTQQAAKGRIRGWRGENFAWWSDTPVCPHNAQIPPFLCAERAGFRHLGMMSHAVHIHGFAAQGDLWCGRRAAHKATDPSMLDNLTAGGVTAGESPLSSALRELAEEAGLRLHAPHRLHWRGAVRTQRLEPQGWHDEQLLVYTLHLSAHETPINTDGEVQSFACLSPGEVITRMQAGQFTVDACVSLAQSLAGLMPHLGPQTNAHGQVCK